MKAATSETAVSGGTSAGRTVRVWDPLVRVFHWSLAASFLGAYLISEDGGQLHRALGYAALGLIAFRLLWGVIGTRHARFASFIPSPRTLRNYVGDVAAHREKRYLGHNPAGAAMIIALLLSVAATGTTGWMMTSDAYWGAEWVEDVHEVIANGTLILVALHVGGVIFSSLRHRENLVRAMITGRKRAE